MEQEYPKEIFGVVLSDEGTRYGSIPLRPLEKDEVLVKIDTATVNPSDIGFASGTYPNSKAQPTTCGFEGSGTVVFCGDDAKNLMGAKVGVVTGHSEHGTWGSHCIMSSSKVLPLSADTNQETACGIFVNPWTVYAFMDICKEKGWKCIINSAAASSLGKMLVKYCKKEGITLINLVRKDDSIQVLKDLGAEIVFNTTSENFSKELGECLKENQADAFFDAVGGKLPGVVLGLMHTNARYYIYGGLSDEPLTLDQGGSGFGNLVFSGRKVSGFWLMAYFAKHPENMVKFVQKTAQDLVSGESQIIVSKRFSMQDWEKACEEAKNGGTYGKVVLKNEL